MYITGNYKDKPGTGTSFRTDSFPLYNTNLLQKVFQGFLILRNLIPLHDRTRLFRSDSVNIFKSLSVLHPLKKSSKAHTSYDLPGGIDADHGNTERIDEVHRFHFPALFNRIQQVFTGFISESLHIADCFSMLSQMINVGKFMYKSFVHKPQHSLN